MTDTKQKLVKALMELSKEKSLDKITVTDLVEKCQVSRQIFYYYFVDIYDVIQWAYVSEAEKVLEENSSIENWQIGYLLLLQWSKKNKSFMLNAYDSISKKTIEYFLNKVLYQYILKVVEKDAEGMNVAKEQKEFIANFYTLALNAISLDWIGRRMVEEPPEVVEKVGIILKGDFKKSLREFEKLNI